VHELNECVEESRASNAWFDIAVDIGRIRIVVDKWFGWVGDGDKIGLRLHQQHGSGCI
jgi:hypothetical protein